ncbi:hypothetical protein L226DRAFT_68182 [Lentinus tigrinus ALCF2SS1-7]|uniref:uncharacterized protein n=1 Tax=Lentinus tigrinus ALCF2SS1-7 TaxID=1328758 RepID=UPI001165F3A8|nr:hypothetical protein L226DRAFT_68182 [Lentinus tigrinus ALCF2SS1-7]
MLSPTAKALLLLVVNVVNVLYILSHVRNAFSPRPALSQEQEYSWRGHDFPEHLPLPFKVERVPVTLEESVHYPPLGAPTDQEWLSIASPSYGYIRLGPEDRTFVITMFHELHCLRMINRAFSKMPGATVYHIKHCLNYIRQGVLCDPDLTLEPGNFEERDFEVERVGGTHMCLNWDPLYEWVDDNYYGWINRTGWVPPHAGSEQEAHPS